LTALNKASCIGNLIQMQNKTPHVIVCDDDAELNPFMRNHFKLDGYESHQALSAKECIDKLAELGDINRYDYSEWNNSI
jgi:hypothetical protein